MRVQVDTAERHWQIGIDRQHQRLLVAADDPGIEDVVPCDHRCHCTRESDHIECATDFRGQRHVVVGTVRFQLVQEPQA